MTKSFISCLGGEQLTFFGATPDEKQDRKAHRLCFSLREHQPYGVGASRSDRLDPVRVCLGTSSFAVRLRRQEIVGTREAGYKREWSARVAVSVESVILIITRRRRKSLVDKRRRAAREAQPQGQCILRERTRQGIVESLLVVLVVVVVVEGEKGERRGEGCKLD